MTQPTGGVEVMFCLISCCRLFSVSYRLYSATWRIAWEPLFSVRLATELSSSLISSWFCLFLAFSFLLQNLSSVKTVRKGEVSLKCLRLPEHKSFSLALKLLIGLVAMSCLESQIVQVFSDQIIRDLCCLPVLLCLCSRRHVLFFRCQRVLFNTLLTNASNFRCWQYPQAFLLCLSQYNCDFWLFICSEGSFVQTPCRRKRCKIGISLTSEPNLNWNNTFVPYVCLLSILYSYIDDAFSQT